MSEALTLEMVYTARNFLENLSNIRLLNLVFSLYQIVTQVILHQRHDDEYEMLTLIHIYELNNVLMVELFQDLCLISGRLLIFFAELSFIENLDGKFLFSISVFSFFYLSICTFAKIFK